MTGRVCRDGTDMECIDTRPGHDPHGSISVPVRQRCSIEFSPRNHGKRVAVIENEFGEIGIDNDLVLNADEEVLEMNNGCIYVAPVRGDPNPHLGQPDATQRSIRLHSHRETTGLADPAPVIRRRSLWTTRSRRRPPSMDW